MAVNRDDFQEAKKYEFKVCLQNKIVIQTSNVNIYQKIRKSKIILKI